jgi:hypothetical protein
MILNAWLNINTAFSRLGNTTFAMRLNTFYDFHHEQIRRKHFDDSRGVVRVEAGENH